MQRTTAPKNARKSKDNEPFCKNEYFVAEFFGVSVGMVRRWRHQGRGPRFLRIGGLVRYRLEDLEAWLASRPIGGEVPQGAER
ncbi:MAG: helix-turn-helix domain-containing protein [Acidobacteria bacterium]|nr:helix-turn-helix domain-containing protein [Acidobacteriota bacterium]